MFRYTTIAFLLFVAGCEYPSDNIKGQIGLSSTANQVACQPEPYGVWKDLNNDGVIQPGDAFLGPLPAYQTPSGMPILTGSQNYNYNFDIINGIDGNPASGQPTYGPALQDQRNTLFFYESSDGLTLYLISSINNGGTGTSDYVVQTSGNSNQDIIQVFDDPAGAEDLYSSVPNAFGGKDYSFHFVFSGNTDGMAIGPFLNSNVTIKIRMTTAGSVQDVDFASPSGQFSLNNPADMGTANQVFSFLIQRTGNSCP